MGLDEEGGVGPEVTVSVTVCGKSARITGPANLIDFDLAAARLMASVSPVEEEGEGSGRVFRLVEVKAE